MCSNGKRVDSGIQIPGFESYLSLGKLTNLSEFLFSSFVLVCLFVNLYNSDLLFMVVERIK